ncbi:MAG: hypothetical protein NTX40_00075 [Planctomycetota bacterium]|nr:hypothetical protein [Planctomycetota bacterium]
MTKPPHLATAWGMCLLGALGLVAGTARAADPSLVPVTKELWEDAGTRGIPFAVVVPPTEGVSDQATAAVELLMPPLQAAQRHPFRQSDRQLLLYQKSLIEFELMAQEKELEPGPHVFHPPVGKGPTFDEALKGALEKSDLVEATERQLPDGRKVTVYVPRKDREKDYAELAFRMAREHLRSPKNIPDRETTIEAEVEAAAAIVCIPRYSHHESQAWSYVVDAYLNDKDGDLVEGLNHFLQSRGVFDWIAQEQPKPAWETIVPLIEKQIPVILRLHEPLLERRHVTVVGIVPADRSLIVAMPTEEKLYDRKREVAPWGTKRVAWATLSDRVDALFTLVPTTKGEKNRDEEGEK